MVKKEITIPKLSKKEQKEFSELVNSNMKRAYFSALGLLGTHDEAMEASQEAFIRAMRHFDRFDRTKKFFTWYYRILKNLCLNKIRDKKRLNHVELLEILETSNTNDNAEAKMEQTELKENVEEALMQLDPDDREIIILKEFENYSYKEIAELVDIPIGTVMSRLFYARKKLARLLEGVEL